MNHCRSTHIDSLSVHLKRLAFRAALSPLHTEDPRVGLDPLLGGLHDVDTELLFGVSLKAKLYVVLRLCYANLASSHNLLLYPFSKLLT